MPKLQASGVFGRALDDNADALNGALWKTYDAGTTTQAATYSDAGLAVQNAWPVIADAAGRFPDIYVARGIYKIRVETSGGALVAETDNNSVEGGGNLVADPTTFGDGTAGDREIDANPMLGGWGTFAQVTLPTRPAWDPIDGPNPTASGNDLEMAGHSIDSGVNSAVILGGRPGYYSWVGDDASLSCTYGGDNINTHIAGMNFGMHSDLVQGLGLDGVTEKGDHGAIFGGSYHRVSGSYSISAGGQIKDVFGLQCGAFAGLNIRIGSLANVDAVRRSVTAGGYLNEIAAGFQSAIIGGERNTWAAGDNGAIIGGDNNEVDNTEHGFIASSQLSKVTADRASVISSTFAVADVPNAITRSVGRDSTAGDSQTHHIEARRTSIGPNIVLSVTGADGADIFTTPVNTRGVVELLVTCQQKSTSVVNGAEYMIRFSYSNLGGTLSILGQTLDVIFENDAAWNCVASVVGSGTRLGVTVQTNGSTATFCATATGRIVMQTISD